MNSTPTKVQRSRGRFGVIVLGWIVGAMLWPIPVEAIVDSDGFPEGRTSQHPVRSVASIAVAVDASRTILSPDAIAVLGQPAMLSSGHDQQFQLLFDLSSPACDATQYPNTRFVDVNNPAASDSNAGTESQPWRTFVHAGASAVPGDQVLVKAGVYDHGDIEIEHGGTCFSAYPGHERQAIVRGAELSSYGNSDLVINGFKFEHSPEHSIRVVGPDSENIVVSNNHTYDTYKSGISIRGVTGNADPGNYDNIRNVLVIGNLVELANNNGGGSEIISVASGAVNVDVAYNEVRYGDPTFENGDEGISFKEGVRDSRIFGNVVHDLSDKAIHIDGGEREWDPLITNIEIFDNVLYNLPSQGMWVVTEGQGDVDGVYIHDNTIYNVESNGILVYPHPDGVAAGGTVRNITIEHNTVWNAGSCGIKIRHPEATGIVIRDNITWENDGCGIWINDYTTIYSHNLCPEAGLCGVTADPLFVDPPTDFGLLPGSPAIGAASDGSNLGARDSTVAAPTTVVRIAGANRYETASELHRFAWPTAGEGSPVYVATGDDYADALASGAIAGHEGGSLLLVQRDGIPAATWAELQRISPDTITIVGGPAAVSAGVATRLRQIATHVDRVHGANRYATAAALSKTGYGPGTNRVYVATGENFPDALAAVPSAARSGSPILLTRRDTLPPETRAELLRLSPNQIVVLGGSSAVSDTVVTQLESIASTVTRLYGSNRYATASAISAAAMGERLHAGTWAYVTSGENFPDALAVGPIAGTQVAHLDNGPILLTLRDTIPAATIAALHAIGPDHIVVIGGTAVLSAAVEQQLRRTDW